MMAKASSENVSTEICRAYTENILSVAVTSAISKVASGLRIADLAQYCLF